jgi:hypothetical protein
LNLLDYSTCKPLIYHAAFLAKAGSSSVEKAEVSCADKDETALAVLALVAGVLHRLKRGDFVN